jgi:glycosyltransferase involved in cell wall biosynthesis
MVITEALAHGLPVIATPTGVGTDPRFQQEIVTVPSNDASALQIAIEKMLKNEPFRLMMRRQIETIATQLTTWNDTARHIAHAVTTTLKGRVI